jgi:hypothetical protein
MMRKAQRDAMRLMALLVLAGCTGLDRAEQSEFHPMGVDRFQYRATTTYFYVSDSTGWAEGQRLRWLETYLDHYAICANGYELTSRQPNVRYISPLGYPVTDIVYRGRCLP